MDIVLKDFRLRRGEAELFRTDLLGLEAGCAVAILGDNGSGKTTFLRALAGLATEFSGELCYGGEPRESMFARGNHPDRVFLLRQDPRLFRGTVAANVRLSARALGLHPAEAAARCREALEALGIAHLATRRARELSVGESRLAALARVLFARPEVLLLDEPFAGVDPDGRARIGQVLQARRGDARLSTVYTTHQDGEALLHAGRILRIEDGRLIPFNPVNIFRGAAVHRDGNAYFLTGDVELEIQPEGLAPAAIHIPPSGIALTARPEDSSMRNRLRGRIVSIALSGAHADVTLDCGLPLTARISLHSLREHGWGVGDELYACFKTHAVHPL